MNEPRSEPCEAGPSSKEEARGQEARGTANLGRIEQPSLKMLLRGRFNFFSRKSEGIETDYDAELKYRLAFMWPEEIGRLRLVIGAMTTVLACGGIDCRIPNDFYA